MAHNSKPTGRKLADKGASMQKRPPKRANCIRAS